MIGRVSSIAIDPSNTKHILLGSAGGGIWESKDSGANWRPRTDKMPSLAIGAVVFDPRNRKRVYAGSGEGNFYASRGAGVYRSIDGGTTWAVQASAPFVGVGFYDLVVDPKTRSILYAATTNGFYKSTNKGSTWSLKRAGRCWDISVHPGGGKIELLAAFQDGVFASTDGGNTFTAVTLPSTPSAPWTRLSIDRVATAPDVAYAFGAAGGAAHLWRRSSAVWTKITSVPSTLSVNQAWYDWYVAATPDSKNQVYIGAIDTLRGDLSGSTWNWTNITTQGVNSVHPDQHCLTFVPGNSQVIYVGNDGRYLSVHQQGSTWTALNKGLAITEVEYLASDPNTWKWLMAEHRITGQFASLARPNGIISPMAMAATVESISKTRMLFIIHSTTSRSNVLTTRATPGYGSHRPTSHPCSTHRSRWPSSLTVGIGAVSLVITRNGAPPWATVPLGLSAGEVSTAMRAIDANTLLIGSNIGHMLKLTWTGAVGPIPRSHRPQLNTSVALQSIRPTAAVLGDQFPGNGAGGRVYRSDNGGASWINRTAGLPNIPINSVVVDPANFKRVWVAADVGVYQTLDLGSTWTAFSKGLPNAMAADLLFHKQDRRLFCATRNRGTWVMPVS